MYDFPPFPVTLSPLKTVKGGDVQQQGIHAFGARRGGIYQPAAPIIGAPRHSQAGGTPVNPGRRHRDHRERPHQRLRRCATAATALIAALFLSTLTATAQPANQRAEREARSYLRSCQETDAERLKLCRTNQRNFIEMYVYAKSGDTRGMGSTASSFAGPYKADDEMMSLMRLGQPTDLVQACAWRLVRVEMTAPDAASLAAAVANEVCTKLSRFDRRRAGERADVLLDELDNGPAQTPADDWEPRVAGLAPDPPPPPTRCLDSSTPEDPPFVPPPGCPGAPKSPPKRR